MGALLIYGMSSQNYLEIISHSPGETRAVGEQMGRLAQTGDTYLLVGGLGAGKTCLTQGIARGLGVEEPYVASPSFVLVREMRGRLTLYHIDLYRLNRIEEIADLGLDDYLYGDGVCTVEWAERGMAVLPQEHLLVEITYLSDNERGLYLRPVGERYVRMVAELRVSVESGGVFC